MPTKIIRGILEIPNPYKIFKKPWLMEEKSFDKENKINENTIHAITLTEMVYNENLYVTALCK